MKKNFLVILLTVFLILSLAGVGYLVVRNNDQSNQISALGIELIQVKSDQDIAQAELTQIQAQATQYAEAATKKGAERQREIVELNRKLDDAEEIALCPNRPKSINYTNNATVSNSLKKWVEEKEKINSVNYHSIWTNSNTAYHELTGQYLYVFIVYFDEPDMGYTNRVFSVGQGCFVDY